MEVKTYEESKKKLYMESLWRSKVIILSLLFISFAACKAKKELPLQLRELENISENRLLKIVSENELDYQTMYSKKMDMTLKNGKESKSFKATMQIQRDSFIWFNMTAPLGIEVGRLLLTRDSIKFVNTYDKKYFLADYDYFLDKFDVTLTFDCIQKMISNHFFSFEDCTSDNKTRRYKMDRSGNNYLLYTLEERAVGRKLKRLYKKRRKNKEFALVLQKIEVDPDYFRPCSISMEDLEEKMGIRIEYKKFTHFGDRIYPEVLILDLFSDSDTLRLEMNIGRLEFDVPVKPNLKIPAKYKRME